jgi:hypothetical protein
MGTENVYLILDLLGLCLIAWMLYFTEGDTWLTREFTFGSSSAPHASITSAGSTPGSRPIAPSAENISIPQFGPLSMSPTTKPSSDIDA